MSEWKITRAFTAALYSKINVGNTELIRSGVETHRIGLFTIYLHFKVNILIQ